MWHGSGLENRQVRKGRGSIPPPSATVTMAAVPRHSRPPRGAFLSLRQTRGVPRRRAAQRVLRRGCTTSRSGDPMAWSNDHQRMKQLPPDWPKRRQQVIKRDRGLCVLCGSKGTDVDHIVRGMDHSLANLRLLCRSCHMKRTGSDGGRTKRSPKRKWKREEPHPGRRT